MSERDRWLMLDHSTNNGRTWERVAVRPTSLVGSSIPPYPKIYDDGLGNLYRRTEETTSDD